VTGFHQEFSVSLDSKVSSQINREYANSVQLNIQGLGTKFPETDARAPHDTTKCHPRDQSDKHMPKQGHRSHKGMFNN
jgi:hypothetical protein